MLSEVIKMTNKQYNIAEEFQEWPSLWAIEGIECSDNWITRKAMDWQKYNGYCQDVKEELFASKSEIRHTILEKLAKQTDFPLHLYPIKSFRSSEHHLSDLIGLSHRGFAQLGYLTDPRNSPKFLRSRRKDVKKPLNLVDMLPTLGQLYSESFQFEEGRGPPLLLKSVNGKWQENKDWYGYPFIPEDIRNILTGKLIRTDKTAWGHIGIFTSEKALNELEERLGWNLQINAIEEHYTESETYVSFVELDLDMLFGTYGLNQISTDITKKKLEKIEDIKHI